MAATVLILLLAVIATPRLLGRSDVSSFPVLRFTAQEGRVHLLVTSVSGDYLYRQVNFRVYNGTGDIIVHNVANSWGESASVSLAMHAVFNITSVVIDRRNYTYSLDAQFVVTQDTGDWLFYVYYNEETRTYRQFELSGPTATPFSIIFPRRQSPSESV